MSWVFVVGLMVVVTMLAFFIMRRSPRAWVESVSMRSDTVRAFEVASDLRRWNPWHGADPSLSTQFPGPGGGLGSMLEWASHGVVGRGRVIITELVPTQSLTLLFEQLSPRASVQLTKLQFVAEGGVCTVAWSAKGDARLRQALQLGLATLKARVEAPGERPASTLHCSFCGKSQREVQKLVSGPNVNICDACVRISSELVGDAFEPEPTPVEKSEPALFAQLQLPALSWGLSREAVLELLPSLVVDRSNLVGPVLRDGVALELRCHFDAAGLAGLSLRGDTRGIVDALGPTVGDVRVRRWKASTADVAFDDGDASVSIFSSVFARPPPGEGSKRVEFEALGPGAEVRLVVDARRDDVRVPERFKSEARLMLNVSSRYASALFVDDGGVSQVLAFAKEESRVVVPWAAVVGILRAPSPG